MEFVEYDISKQGVASITMNRPKVHNAFNDQMIQELIQVFQQADQDQSVRVVVLQAAGKNFSAGADLNWMKSMAQMDEQQNKADADQLAKLMSTVYSLNKPVIAKVQGASYGGALGLIAACDIAVATNQSQFCLSEVKIGLVPAVISPYVVEAIGVRNARRYMQTAEVFNASQAASMGLLHETCDCDGLDDLVQKLALQLCANGPNAVAAAKKLVTKVAYQAIDESILDETAKLIAKIRVSEEGQEGLSAFLEKRKPSWK